MVWPASVEPTDTNAEVARVTSKGSGDDWTITRTQEGSSARTIVVGDQVALTITNKVLKDVEDNKVEKSGDTMTGPLVIDPDTDATVLDVKDAASVSQVSIDTNNSEFTVAMPFLLNSSFTFTSTDTGTSLLNSFRNTQNHADADAGISLEIKTSGGTFMNVALGLDNSDDLFKISNNSSVGVNDMLQMDVSGNLRHPGYLRVGSISAPTNTTAGDLTAVRGFFSGALSASSLSLTTDLPITEGGTGASSASAARTNLGAQSKVFYTVGAANADYITDGTADEVQIQQAIDAVDTAGGGTVFIKEGTYSIAAPIVIDVDKGLHLMGSGFSTILQAVNGLNDNVIEFDTTAAGIWAKFSNFAIYGNCANQTAGHGIYAPGSLECVFDTIWFHQVYNYGLYLYRISAGNYGHNNRVVNCIFDEGDDSAGIGGGIYTEENDENHFIGNDFQFMGGSGSRGVLDAGYCIYDKSGLNTISNNAFVNSYLGVQIRDSGNSIVADNVFDRPSVMGLLLRGRHNTVKNNVFYQMGENSGTTNAAIGMQIEFYNAEQVNNNWFMSAPTNNATRSFIKDNSDATGGGDHQFNDNYFFVDGTLGTGILEITGTPKRGQYIGNRGNTLLPAVTKTAAYTATVLDKMILCDASGGAFTVTLPAAQTAYSELVVVKTDSSGNAVTVSRAGSDTIEGSNTISLSSQYSMAMLRSDGNALWYKHTNATSGGSGSPGGSDTQVQYNDGGSFNGDSQFTWDETNDRLTVKTVRINDSVNTKSFDLSQDNSFSRIKANNTGWVLESANFSDILLDPGGGTGNGVVKTTTGIVINDSGFNSDTQIKGDTDANLFYLDASADKIGIGNAAPDEKLHVTGNIKASGALTLGTDLAVTEGGTGASTAAGARTNLGTQAKVTYTVGSSNADYVTDGTSDQTEINSAITAANAAGGGTVELKEGTFTISDNILTLSNVTIRGQGRGTVIKLVNSASSLTVAGMIRVKDKTHVVLEDFAIDGNKANQANGTNKMGLYIEGDYITVRNLYVHDTATYGIDAHEKMTDNSFSTYLLITGNHVKDCGDASLGSHDGITLDKCQYSVVSNNLVEGSARQGISLVTGSQNNAVTGNTVKGSTDNGINLNGSTASVDNNTVAGNVVYGSVLAGIKVAAASYNTVSGNTVEFSTRYGIEVYGASYNAISGNAIMNSSQAGSGSYDEIGITDNTGVYSTYNSVTGNVLNSTNGRKGIRESHANCDFNIYVGNTVSGTYTGTPIVDLLGANSKSSLNTAGDDTAGSGGTPGGSTTQVQFNDAGAFGGDAGLTYNKTTDKLTIVGDIETTTGNLYVANDKVMAFADGAAQNNQFKSGTDGTFIFDIAAGNSVHIKGGDAVGAEALRYTDSSFNTEWQINTLGTSTQNGGATINEGGQDADTRIEGDTNANLFFVDASTNRIGIGTNTPDTELDIIQVDNGSGGIKLQDSKTDATDKVGRIKVGHYTVAEEPVTFFIGSMSLSENRVSIGGGSASENASTKIRFMTAANTTTTAGTERLGIYSDGNIAVGAFTPTAKLHIAAGAAAANSAPFKLTSGTNLTTAEAGAVEYDGKAFYSTPNASNRAVNTVEHFISQTANFNGTNVATAQPVFNATAAGTITLPGTTSYIFEGHYHIHTAGTTSHQLGILFGGTATLTSIGYSATATNVATEILGPPSTIWIAVATVTNVSPATATATHHTVLLKGIVRVNAAGTFIPQYQWSAAPGAVGTTLANSYFKMTPIGSNTIASVGNWS